MQTATSQPSSEVANGLAELLTAAVPELMRRMHVPGLNLAVAVDGELVWEEAFGFADLGSKRPMTVDTVFRSGSMGKTYVATAVMQLVEAGRIALDGTASDYLGFELTNPLGKRPVTVEDLLTHRSGLSANAASSSFAPPPALEDHLRADIAAGQLDMFRGAAPKWSEPVGEAMQYSNTAIALLGLIVQRMNGDGLSYGRYIEEHIVKPLGMTSTYAPDGNYDDPERVPPEVQDRISTGYVGWGSVNAPTPKIYFKDFPAGLILTIPRDHVRVLLAYLNGGTYNGHQLLRAETVDDMLTPRVEFVGRSTLGGGPTMVGLTWCRGNLGRETEWFGHGGAHMWGWHHDYRAYPKLNLAIAVATNRWDLANSSSDAPNQHISILLEEIAAAFLANPSQRRREGSGKGWEWKRSYALGLNFALSTLFYLGIREHLTPAMIDALLAGATDAQSDGLDPEGFRSAVADFAEADLTVEGLDAFIDSDRCRLSRAELNAVWRDVGGTGEFPFPMSAALRSAFGANRTRVG